MNTTETIHKQSSYYIKTHGCQMNEEDSLKMANLLEEKLDMQATQDVSSADLVVLNTCSIREKAQEKVFSELGRWKKSLGYKSNAVIAVAGCVASQEAEQIFKRAPFVQIVIGPQTIHRLADLYIKCRTTSKRQIDVSFPAIEKFDHLPQNTRSSVSAHLTIMEGCNKFCSYCIVPYTRGEEISRHFSDVINEAKTLLPPVQEKLYYWVKTSMTILVESMTLPRQIFSHDRSNQSTLRYRAHTFYHFSPTSI